MSVPRACSTSPQRFTWASGTRVRHSPVGAADDGGAQPWRCRPTRPIARAVAALHGCAAARWLPRPCTCSGTLFSTCGLADEDASTWTPGRTRLAAGASSGLRCAGSRRTFPTTTPKGWSNRPNVRRCRLRPLVLADGICPGLRSGCPLAAYLRVAQRLGGRVVIDDTQAVGVLGARALPAAPFGRGGGGSLRWHAGSTELVVWASLAKGFGSRWPACRRRQPGRAVRGWKRYPRALQPAIGGRPASGRACARAE